MSFNIAVTESQRQARAAVVLPYMRAQQAAAPGEVTYHLDEADDFDEEDPDDDLDI